MATDENTKSKHEHDLCVGNNCFNVNILAALLLSDQINMIPGDILGDFMIASCPFLPYSSFNY